MQRRLTGSSELFLASDPKKGQNWRVRVYTGYKIYPGESENLMGSHRRVAKKLSAQLHQWLSKEEPT